MESFLDGIVRSDKQFLVKLMVGFYILSFIISFIGSFPIGFPPVALSTLLEGVFTTFTLYSAIVSAWIVFLFSERVSHTKIFMGVSWVILVTTSLLVISANFYFRVTLYLRAIALLTIGITPLSSFVMLYPIFKQSMPEQSEIINYLLTIAIFILGWGIHTAFQPFQLPNILKTGLTGTVAVLYTMVALISLLLAVKLTRREGKSVKFLLLPSLAFVTLGTSIGIYLQRYAPETFRLFEMIISEPWRWAIGYDLPIFSQTYNYLFYLIFPATVLPLGWQFFKQVSNTQASSWKYILFGWIILFVCGAGSSDAFEMIGKLIGYLLLFLGVLTLLNFERRADVPY